MSKDGCSPELGYGFFIYNCGNADELKGKFNKYSALTLYNMK